MVLENIYEISVNHVDTKTEDCDDIFEPETPPVLKFRKIVLRLLFNPSTDIYSVRYVDNTNNIFCDAFTVRKDAFVYILRASKLAMKGKLIFRYCRGCNKKFYLYDEKCYCPIFEKYVWKAELNLDNVPKHMGYTSKFDQVNFQYKNTYFICTIQINAGKNKSCYQDKA